MGNVIQLKKEGPKPKITICIKCKNFINLEPDSGRKHSWYNHLCKATPLPTKIDPYDGKIKPYDIDDLGREHFSENRFKFCRDINNGKCTKFQPLKTSILKSLFQKKGDV